MKKLFLILFVFDVAFPQEEKTWTTVPCNANVEQAVNYRKVSWYKVKENVLTGLVLKDLEKNSTTLFKYANFSYEVDPDFSLKIPGISRELCGMYRCTLWPPLGHHIRNADFEIVDPDCVTYSLQVAKIKTNEHTYRLYLFACVLVPCAFFAILFLTLKKIKMLKKMYVAKKPFPTDENL